MKQAKHTPICPKCGYDQCGEIATWESVCPLDGQCPECGLGFSWRDIFDPVRMELGWNVEHAHSLWEMFKRTPRTLFRLMIPYFYWRAVGVETPIRLWVLVRWQVVFSLVLHLLVSIPYGIGNWSGSSVQFYGSLSELYDQTGWKGLSVPFVNGVGFPWVVLRADYANNSVNIWFPVFRGSVLASLFGPVFLLMGMVLLWAIVMLAIPVTRRQARLRARHVVRAALISGLAMLFAYQGSRLAEGIDEWTRVGFTINNIYQGLFGAVVMPALVLWLMVFWWFAVITGWKVRPCKGIIVLGTIASLLGGVVLLYVTSMLFGWY